MTHILYGAMERQVATSDDEWLSAATQVGEFVNKRAARTDVTAVVGADLGGKFGTACFIPAYAEIQINTTGIPMGLPNKVDLADRMWTLTYAPAVGAMTHEAAHARHTRWDPRNLMDEHGATRKMVDVITTLEEPRIEAQALRFHPASRVFVRPMAMEIVAKDFKIGDSRYGAAAAAGLLLARVDAKVFTRADVAVFRREIVKVLGKDTLDLLEPLWKRFLRLYDEDYAGMVEVAAAWLEALGEDPEDSDGMVGASMMGVPLPGDPGEDEPGEGEGDGEGNPAEGFGGKIMAKVHVAETKMDKEVVEARGDERAERARAEREADAKRRAESEGPHGEAFDHKGGHGYSPGGFSHYAGSRQPTADERRAAKMLARTLEKIDYRDRAVSKVTSVVPPGRLRGRAAVQAEALAARGEHAEVALWQGKRRKRVESTPLTIGFLGDISGSMGAAMEPLASSQWVVSTAGNHIDAKVASVHFGVRIHGIAPCGVREKDVRVFRANDGSEAFKAAALAIDRELNLLDGSGARLLFIGSDGCFVNGTDHAYAQTFMPLARRKGVGVFFLDFDNAMGYGSYGASVIDCCGKSPVQVAQIVGKAAVAEMRRLDSRV